MVGPSFNDIVDALNEKAVHYNIGQLQSIRKECKGLKSLPGNKLFSEKSTKIGESLSYAFHHGARGRSELQFNIGDDQSGGELLRHGVAFSFQTSRTLRDIGVLEPKVRPFNEFLRLHRDMYADMRMWHWNQHGERSKEYPPAPIGRELVVKGVFVFLGKIQEVASLDYDSVLRDFDRLLPLYRFVECEGDTLPN